MLKTLVYQSFRTTDVPLWIERAMKSVRDWAEVRGYDYEFIDDKIFDLVPEWYLKKAEKITVITRKRLGPDWRSIRLRSSLIQVAVLFDDPLGIVEFDEVADGVPQLRECDHG